MRSFTELFIDSLVDHDSFVYYLEEGFNPDLLDREEAKAIWHFVREYYERGRRQNVPDLEALTLEFPKWRFEDTEKEPHYILDKLKEQWRFRESRQVITSLSTMGAEEVFPYIKGKLWEAEQVLDTERNVVTVGDFDKMMDNYYAKWESNEKFGYTTGFKAIDDEMGGIRKGQLAVIAGRLKTGKTWFGLKSFIEQRHQGQSPIFFTLELSTEEIWDRYMALISGISFNAIDKGYLDMHDIDRIKAAIEEEKQYGPFYVVQPPQGQRKVADFVALADKYKADSMIIDQLNWIEARQPDSAYFRDDLRIGDIAKELKLAAQRPGREMPIYVMHQFNRKQKADEVMDDTNYGDSDKILQVADHGFGVAQTAEQREAKVIRFEIVRSRHSRQGGTFTCDFEFYDKTNMSGCVPGDTVGDMAVDDAAILVARAFDGSLQTV